MKVMVTIDFDQVYCNPDHMTASGKGWGRRFRDLGASDEEVRELVRRLKIGMAAEIELKRIRELAGVQ